jgi:hypothetical protein
MSEKEKVDGIILVISCQKYKETRLKEFKLNKDSYENWKVIYVVGDFFLEKNYELRENILWVKCEDSYLHILKKLALAMKYLYEIYDIKNGVLRCGDDLIFDENALLTYLRSPKYDFHGQTHNNYKKGVYKITSQNIVKNIKADLFMYDYYESHPEDFENPQHNIKGIDFKKYVIVPNLVGPVGVMYYIANSVAKTIISHMEQIDFNVLHYDTFSKSYPYIIEDIGIAFITHYHLITFANEPIFFDKPGCICFHTNKYKS